MKISNIKSNFKKIGNILMIANLHAQVLSTYLKTGRENIDELGKQEIIEHGLYHITSEEAVKGIIESEHLRPARGIMKNINSYGTACVCFFNGIPSIENFMKNLTGGKKQLNPYINPTMVLNAVKVTPTRMEELANYKVRNYNDEVIVYEGYCILPKDKVQDVHLVPDLVRDKVTGKPQKNPKTGRYEVSFREASEEELENDGKSYRAKEDYLKFMDYQREKLGFFKGTKGITGMLNNLSTIGYIVDIERRMSKKNKVRIIDKIKQFIKSFTTPKLDMSTDEKITSVVKEIDLEKKNPYRDKNFGQAVAAFQAQGLEQLNLKQELENITTSDIGEYFRKKYNQIDKSSIIQKGIHGINHNNRVAIHSMIIAKREGLLENDNDNRTKDILLSAAYYHDILYLNRESYSPEDKKILQAIIEAHGAKDKKVDKICEKYKISETDREYAKNLINIIKDADALDRARLDLNSPFFMITDLNTKYLRTNTAKQLLNASYQLEALTKKTTFDRILAYKTKEQSEMGKTKKEKFVDSLRQGVGDAILKSQPIIEVFNEKIKPTKRKIKSVTTMIGKKIGRNRNKIIKILESRLAIEKDNPEDEMVLE